MTKHHFYKTGLDITNTKEVFNFLKNHFTYDTMNSWNCLQSIANNVKVFNLGLDGDCYVALNLLQLDDYATINYMIEYWEYTHEGYSVGFNGRSGGYLVLYGANNNGNILPDCIVDNDYEEFKEYCKEYWGGVKYYKSELKDYVKLVQDFDKLCDEIRVYVNELSIANYELDELNKLVNKFNCYYEADLDYLELNKLVIDDSGKVYVGEITKLRCMNKAFIDLSDRSEYGLELVFENDYAYYKRS